MNDFPNARDCEHGRQRGKCVECALNAAEARIAELERDRDRLQGFVDEDEALATAVHEYLPECTCDADGNLGNEIERIEFSGCEIKRLETALADSRESNARLNRRAQEAEAKAVRTEKIERRIAERDRGKPLPRIEAAFALAAAEVDLAALRSEVERMRAEAAWVPCSERMPEKRLIVLVTQERHDMGRRILRACAAEGEWNADVGTIAFDDSRPVLAWRPLPAPYNPEAPDA